VVQNSRFAQAALLLQSGASIAWRGCRAGRRHRQGLDSLAARIPVAGFLEPGSAPSVAAHALTVNLDSLLAHPGDDLKRLRFTAALAVPMAGRSGTEGALLLAGIRNRGAASMAFSNQLHADDLLPVEMLTTRLQATRSQTMMFEKLIDSEKFAGLGQLAANVAEQLNNPLTVVLGYASLLDEGTSLETPDRKAVGQSSPKRAA